MYVDVLCTVEKLKLSAFEWYIFYQWMRNILLSYSYLLKNILVKKVMLKLHNLLRRSREHMYVAYIS